jgi:hypothetical protein
MSATDAAWDSSIVIDPAFAVRPSDEMVAAEADQGITGAERDPEVHRRRLGQGEVPVARCRADVEDAAVAALDREVRRVRADDRLVPDSLVLFNVQCGLSRSTHASSRS